MTGLWDLKRGSRLHKISCVVMLALAAGQLQARLTHDHLAGMQAHARRLAQLQATNCTYIGDFENADTSACNDAGGKREAYCCTEKSAAVKTANTPSVVGITEKLPCFVFYGDNCSYVYGPQAAVYGHCCNT